MSEQLKNIALVSSAGAGKTRELTKRYLYLYLHKEQYPLDSLYAITFTNEAAFEMKARILRYLDVLITGTASNESEQEIIDYFTQRFPDLKNRAQVKKTYLLNNLSELHVSTFHSLFASFLSSIPFAAGILPGYAVIDEIQEQLMYEQALDAYFEAVFEDEASLVAINKLLEQTEVAPKYRIQQIHRHVRPWLGFLERLCTQEKTLAREVKHAEKKFVHALAEVKQFILDNRDAGRTQKGVLHTSLQTVLDTIDDYTEVQEFSTLEKSTCGKSILAGELSTKKYMRDFSHKCGAQSKKFDKIIVMLKEAVRGYVQALSDHEILLHLKPVLQIHAQFQQAKQRQNVVSFDDIETYTLEALEGAPDTEYLYFKIGTVMRHLMIDEFQDTSHRQLDIIDPLIEEITSVVPREKSIFYVGDPKQAIFRWRGGTSELFDVLLERYKGKITRRELVVNYRSKEEIIKFVNLVLDKNDQPKPDNTGGWIRVELCGNYDDVEEGSEAVIKRTGCIIHELHKTYGYAYADIAVLVRTNKFGAAVADYLAKHKIPCVGASRADIMNDHDVRFVLNLLTFLDNPENDFALMHVLLSPFFDFKEETLRRLKGTKKTLYLSLRAAYPDRKVTRILERLLARVQFLNPYQLVYAAYRELGIRISYALATLLDVAMEYTKEGEGQLTSFIEWLKQTGPSREVKSAFTEGVKVLTVHKAKGLEFEIVIIPETNATIDRGENPQLLFAYKQDVIPDRIYWRKYGKYLRELKEAEKKRMENDARNLLYVALTRARSGVHVLGYNHAKRKLGFWFSAIREKTKQDNYSIGEIVKKPAPEIVEEKAKTFGPLHEDRVVAREERVLYSPTERGIEILDTKQRKSMEFGLIVHDALSYITWLDHADIEQTVDTIIKHTVAQHARTREQADEIAGRLRPILSELFSDPELRFIFYKDNRDLQCKNEAPIYFEDEKRDVSGYIDRLLITPESITIIDYKTGDDKPEYRQQMAVYTKGMQKVYPGRKVTAFLVFLERDQGSRLLKL